MQAARLGRKDEGVSHSLQPVGHLYVLGAPELGTEASDVQHSRARNRGVARVELAWRRVPLATSHGVVLLLKHRQFPIDPWLEASAGWPDERADHHLLLSLLMHAPVRAEKFWIGNDVVVEEDQERRARLLAANIARH